MNKAELIAKMGQIYNEAIRDAIKAAGLTEEQRCRFQQAFKDSATEKVTAATDFDPVNEGEKRPH